MAYTCPFCGSVSQDPNDEANRYCGRCHTFEDQEYTRRHMADWQAGAVTHQGEDNEDA